LQVLTVLIIILLLVIIVPAVAAIGVYNGLIRKKNAVESAWAQIDTQLQKRFDLVPNLVETVKGYMQHEQEVFDKISEARTKYASSGKVKDIEEADMEISGALSRLMAISEDNPELKANENFNKLQEDLNGIEGKLASARGRYNKVVQSYNTSIQKFPAVILANMMGFEPADYFEVESDEVRKSVKVEF